MNPTNAFSYYLNYHCLHCDHFALRSRRSLPRVINRCCERFELLLQPLLRYLSHLKRHGTSFFTCSVQHYSLEMVLGITLRRRKTIDEPQPLQPSPSLPTLTSTGLVSPAGWPAGLIDIKKVQEEIAVEANGDPAVDYPNATYKSNFQSSPGQQVPSFHRPFRPQNLTDAARDGASDDGIPARTSIA